MANDPSNNHFADPVYDNGYKFQLRLTVKNEKMEKRINYLVEANNELMKELEQWERARKVDELAPDSLSPEESQIVRMPWLKEHHEKD